MQMPIPGDRPTPAQVPMTLAPMAPAAPAPALVQRVADPIPVRLSERVAGSLSRLQGLLQAAAPAISDAYAAHWLATREAGRIPEFQQATAPMLWGLYGMEALSGLLRIALTGRATTEVLGGIIDMLNLINLSFQQADMAWARFLQRAEALDLRTVPRFIETLQPLGRTFAQMQEPARAVLQGVDWRPWVPSGLVPMRHAFIEPTMVAPPGALQPLIRPQWQM